MHQLWTNAGTLAPQELSFDLHEFLGYCGLLRRLRERFEHHDGLRFHDACLFFLRGSYGLWAYLNTASDLRLRGTVFGGLNPGPGPKAVFGAWLLNTLRETASAARTDLDLLMVDEVDSGTGIGTQLKVVDATLAAWTGTHIGVRITYLAAARPEHKENKLSRTIAKWEVPRSFTNATLQVTFDRVIGTLLAYDDDDLLGIARRAHGYEVVKREGSTIIASCPDQCHRDCALVFATAGAQVESIGSLAGAIASARASAPVKNLDAMVERVGCPVCKRLWDDLRPAGLPRTKLCWRSRWQALRRWGCRRCRRRRAG